jgi:hypothetical protein
MSASPTTRTRSYDPIVDSSPGSEFYRSTGSDDPDGPGYDGLILLINETGERSERGPCHCGCKFRVNHPESVFLPGHDQRLKGKLIRAGKAGVDITVIFGGVAIGTDAIGAANHLLVTASGIDQVRSGVAEAEASRTLVHGVVKVGRWTYPAFGPAVGQPATKRAPKRDGSGEWVETTATLQTS